MKKALEYIKEKINDFSPEIAVILGSGLGELADEYENSKSILYKDIPGFKSTKVDGHKGQLVFCEVGGKKVVFMQGRYHYYEGHSIKDVILPIKIFKLLGVKNLIITNAAGGLNTDFKPGSLMLIEDHINFTSTNPLIGENDPDFGVRFPDMTEVYDKELLDKAQIAAKELNIEVEKGVYIGVIGPSYETPAEIRMFRSFGADAIGMSTVNEAIFANYCHLKILGISCITNFAAGLSSSKLDHQEVVDTANRVKNDFKRLIKQIIKIL